LLPGLLNAIPHLDGAVHAAPPDRVYLGYRHQASDLAQYMAIARHAADSGDIGAPNSFVTEDQDGRFILGWLWLTGRTSRLLGTDLVLTYHALGFIASWAFFVVAWLLISAVIEPPATRRTAFLLACFSAGLMWLPFAVKATVWPSLGLEKDALLYSFNWSTFASCALPMWCAAHACFLGALVLVLDPTPRKLEGCALLIIAAYVIHPYTALAALAVMGAQAVLGTRAMWRPIIVAAAGIGALSWWATRDPVYAATAENVTLWTPHYNLWWYPLTYGLTLGLALAGLGAAWRLRGGLLVTWAGVVAALAICPFMAGVKFQYLLHLPLCLLAAVGLDVLTQRYQQAATLAGRRAVVAAFWVLVCAGSVFALVRDMPSTEQDPNIYASQSQLDLLEALNERKPGNVLTSFQGGLLVPWKSGKAVFLGHWFLSYDYPKRADLVRTFFAGPDPDWKRAFLDSQKIRYVVEDPHTRALGAADRSLGLSVVFENEFGRILAR